MSTPRGCVTVERFPGQWWCVVADREGDYDFNHYTVYGPEPTAEKATALMFRYESNPGGGMSVPFKDMTTEHELMVDDVKSHYKNCRL